MASNIFVGRWTDYSLAAGHRDVITLTVRDGAILIAALSTFVGFVGTSFWSLLAFCIHQCRAAKGAQDGVYFQQQVLYRNTGTPAAAFLDILRIAWAWRKPSTGPRRVATLKTRSFVFALPPLFTFVGFAIAGVLVSKVAGKAYDANHVLVAQDRCGYLIYDTTIDSGLAAISQKWIEDSLTGKRYAADCYSNNPTSISFAACRRYASPSLPWSGRNVSCPFGHSSRGISLCLPGQNTAYQLSTLLLDSNDAFGINAPSDQRVSLYKHLTCAPLDVNSYVSRKNSTGQLYYYLGPAGGVGNYSFTYDPRITGMGYVGYQLSSLAPIKNVWSPINVLQTSDGDMTIHFMSPNNIQYLQPVDDIFFAAHDPSAGGTYWSDSMVSVMGCVDQYQICNPNYSPPSCTNPTSLDQLKLAMKQIGFNQPQNITAYRLSSALGETETFTLVGSLGASALLAQSKLYQVVSTGLPVEQWKIEVEGWFKTSLAMLQAKVVEYVSKTSDLGPYATVLNPVSDIGKTYCSQQRIQNVGGYQTISVLGLMIIIIVGSLIILLNWTVEPLLGYYRSFSQHGHHNHREIARIADRTLQLQRVALNYGQNEEKWEKIMESIPVTKSSTTFLPPKLPGTGGPDQCNYDQQEQPLIELQNQGTKPSD